VGKHHFFALFQAGDTPPEERLGIARHGFQRQRSTILGFLPPTKLQQARSGA
jgi:hypothetical protein